MEQLHAMKESLINCVQSEIYNLNEANAEELGAAVDMIKDLSEAIYYCTITDAMKENDEKKKKAKYRVIMIFDADHLSLDAQQSLRRTMETGV